MDNLMAKGSGLVVAIAYAFVACMPYAFADHVSDAEAAVGGLQEKDEAACAKPFKSGPFTFTPLTQALGHVTSFKISRGNQVLLTKASHGPADPIFLCFVSFPVIKVPKFKRTFNAQRLIADIVGMHPLRAASPFLDLNGDGVPDVIVSDFSGGAHCCSEYHVYSLGATAKEFDELSGLNTQWVVADLLGDARYEAVGIDWAFASWHATNVLPPGQLVILRPGKNGYKLAPDLMRTSPPSSSEFQALVDESKRDLADDLAHDDQFGITNTTWKNMLAVIYTGHSNLAWRLLDKCWPAGMRGNLGEDDASKVPLSKNEFRKAFLQQLSTSSYWDGLKELNKTDPILCSFRPAMKKK